ncbi:MAG: SDR family oxidoreductase [bacterium]|nr:SDR family oxidoreductase [bacterium]
MLKKHTHPKQKQREQPGVEHKMTPQPEADNGDTKNTPRLGGKVALITGGDSGIGRAAAVSFAKEGASVAIVYLNEHKDAKETKRMVEEYGGTCLLISGNIGKEIFAKKAVRQTLKEFGGLDILVNNAAEQHPQDSIMNISERQLEKTFRTNIFSFFFFVKAALPHLKKGSVIINTSSVVAYRGSWHLLDYAATKGAIISFTRSLSAALVEKGIRVNAVAPGAVWTPLIPSTFKKTQVAKFGTDNPMKRAAEPSEIAPAFVFLASEDSSFMTGQVLHPNGGEIING